MRKKLEFQYYYKQNECKAEKATDASCFCWHDEGSGPCKEQRHTDVAPMVDWRIKSSNVKLRGSEAVPLE